MEDLKIYIASESMSFMAPEAIIGLAASYFTDYEYQLIRYPNVKTAEKALEIIQTATENAPSMIVFSSTHIEVRDTFTIKSLEANIPCLDVLTPAVRVLGKSFNTVPIYKPEFTWQLGDEYYKRIHAIEFAINNDDGKSQTALQKADIVLIGVSRTSKTPLSIYLAYLGYLVVNIPLVMENKNIQNLLEVPVGKVIGLTISPNRLHQIRNERNTTMGVSSGSEYADMNYIINELEYADTIMKKIGCSSIDITNRAVEETAELIIKRLKSSNTNTMEKYVYSFLEGGKEMKSVLGGKGANLAEMTKIGLPVPSGFTISTGVCSRYFQDGQTVASEILDQINEGVSKLEKLAGKQFDGTPPLLVSVRSGAPVSMPGMMDTILNLGLNDENVEVLGEKVASRRFALDCYRRFIQMYANVVLELPMYQFEQILEQCKANASISNDKDLSEYHLSGIIDQFKAKVLELSGSPFEQSPRKQLYSAIEAVFRSWNNERAKIYRQINHIPDEIGTAVNVQMMVFGNMGDTSGTGVVFTRNPSTGVNEFYGEFLMNAQGEDVVAGIRTPLPILQLEDVDSGVYDELLKTSRTLEQHYKDMQDIEFTIENGKFFLLQTRNGKRSASAAVKLAVDFVTEQIVSKQEAIAGMDLSQVDRLLHPEFDPDKIPQAEEIGSGLPASPGAASGQIYFNSKSAEAAKANGQGVILVRVETSPEDIQGMISSNGVLTARGGMTSHAAVVARGMGKCCVTSCSGIDIDEEVGTARIGAQQLKEGDYISLDGSTGKVYLGEIATKSVSLNEDFTKLMGWADEISRMKVLANADTPGDAARARSFGARGIGLCRTEHMFFEGKRVLDIREMIMARTDEKRKAALEKLFPHQKEDFKEIFKVMEQLPVTVRLLDPPLHEFLPKGQEELQEMATQLGVTFEEVVNVTHELEEVNPMMGLRGCRLGLIYPEIYEMQARAIVMAALEVKQEKGFVPVPEIMIPLVGNEAELSGLRKKVEAVIATVDTNSELSIRIGTMIEVPRACMVADRIAAHADYFSFGTNDLTQMTLGYSRDDAGKFIKKYKELKVLEADPFQQIDKDGVGELIKIAIKKGKQTDRKLKIGVCGEHGGDATSVAFFNGQPIDYVSCSPYRVPKARLAAAQAELNKRS